MKQLSCDQCRERWDEFISKSTFEADATFADVRAHLESCEDCRKMADALIAARQELQQFPSPKAPVSLRANVLGEIEKPQKSSIAWWNSPQRLAWASGTIVAVFLVALLIRPERQAQVLQTPKVLSNKSQIEKQNSAPAQPDTPPKPQHRAAAKVLSQKPRTIQPAKPSPKPQRIKPEIPEPKSPPKSVTPAPKLMPDNTKFAPAPSAPQFELPEKTAPEVPAPATNNDPVAKSADAAIQSKSMNRSMAQGLRGPEGPREAMATFKSSPTIHWSKIITSDYEVANAKITVTLGEGLSFVGDTHNESERILWNGTLHRGKEIPLDVDLHKTATEPAKLHLLMIDTDTQKVLLDKTFDVK